MAVDNTTVIPVIYSATLIRRLDATSVYRQLVNRQWQADYDEQGGGDRVKINVGDTNVTVADYVEGTTAVAGQTLDAGSAVDLILNFNKFWALETRDIAQFQSRPSLLEDAMADAAVKLAKEVDDDIRAAMDTAATDIGATAADMDTVATSDANRADQIPFLTIARRMDLAHVPQEGRFVVIGPYSAELIGRASAEKTGLPLLERARPMAPNATARQDVQPTPGLVGRTVNGLDIYVDTQNSTLASGTATEEWIAGSRYSCAYVEGVREVENVRLPSRFATQIRGLLNYGIAVVESASLFKTTLTIANVP